MTATAAALTPRSPTERRPSTLAPDAAFAGTVDLSGLEPDAGIDARHVGPETRLLAPGLEVRLDTRRGAWHATPRTLLLVVGRPRIDGRASSPEQLDDLLSGQEPPWRRLGGRFALVRVELNAGEILLATDRFGVWPLAWARSGPRVAFSDRADHVAPGHAELDPQSIHDYVYFHVIPAPRTIFRGVRRVEPATAVHVSGIRERQQSTWSPRFAEQTGTEDAALADAFRAAIRAAVLADAHDAAVGCFLSGGTDSSTVSGMLARHGERPVPTFSIGFDAQGYDEMAYARIAARHFGTEHHEYYVSPDDLTRAIPRVAREYDGPFGNSSAVPAYYCALFARHHGVQRLLAGDGGDELFGGNLRYARQNVFEAYQRIPESVRRRLLEPLLATSVAGRVPGLSKAASYVAQARIPMPARLETYNLLKRFGAENVFAPAFIAQVDTTRPETLQASVYAMSVGAALVDRMLQFDWRFTLADNDLPKVTGTTRLAGLDVAFPFLDDAVVDLSLRLDAEQKVRGLQLRPFFKDALADFLPREIIRKKKHGFGLPVGPWLVSSPSFRALAYESVNALVDRRLLQPALAHDLFSRRLEEHPGYYGEMIWVLMMLEQWLRAHAPSWSCR